MHPSIGTVVAEQFRITTNLFIKAMSGIEAAEAMRRPGPLSNPLLWLAGHVTHFRTRLLTIVGVPRDFPWGSVFDTGAKVGAPELYPSPEEIVAVWEETSELLMQRLAMLTEDDLSAPPVAKVPPSICTVPVPFPVPTFRSLRMVSVPLVFTVPVPLSPTYKRPPGPALPTVMLPLPDRS